MLKTVLAICFSVFLTNSAFAEPVPVKAAEIKALLLGNSIEGTWSGSAYKQFFDASGSTTYAPRGSSQSSGKWRVNEQTNQYESWWERSGWSGYGVVRDGESLFWTSSGLETQPFKIIEGRHLNWDH